MNTNNGTNSDAGNSIPIVDEVNSIRANEYRMNKEANPTVNGNEQSSKNEQPSGVLPETPALFKRFIKFFRLSFFLTIVGLACSDVRDYYSIGRPAHFWLISFPSIISFVWLISALKARKSWARKLVIVYTFLTVAGLCCTPGFETPLSKVFLIFSTLIDLYCLILLFDNEVKAVFLPDSKATGAQATVNRYQVAFYLIFISVWLLVYTGVVIYRQSSSMQFVKDCTAAAQKGSANAIKDLKVRANYSDEIGEECRKVLYSLGY